METSRVHRLDPLDESLLLITELGRASDADDDPESSIYSLLERLGALLKASDIALIVGGERGSAETIFGRGDRLDELRAVAERFWKARREAGEEDPPPVQRPWTLLALTGKGGPSGILAIRLGEGEGLRPAAQS
ncbi:hypothetical protein, partial [Methylacidimicrobium cyclopophantes]|uniref:hypothetical protein n=1 Tax=Methylacidimicrobium cyclopophantes TaxID=1041766 RepID=UPI00115962E0